MTASSFTRAQWLGLCASAQADLFHNLLGAHCHGFRQDMHQATTLRGPEVCLLQLPARVDGLGGPFIFSEATATRCSLRHRTGLIGHSMVLGRQLEHAKNVAFFDALMQEANWARTVGQAILTCLGQALAERQTLRSAQAELTKVQFFTLAREADTSDGPLASVGSGT